MSALRTLSAKWDITSGEISLSFAYIKRAERVTFSVSLTSDGAAYTLPANSTLTLTVKPDAQGDADALLIINSFTESATSGTYTASAQLSSIELDTYLAINNNTADDEAYKDIALDINYSTSSVMQAKSDTASLILKPDVGSEDDGTPSSVADPDTYVANRAVLYDRSQSLSAGQKLQAVTNQGLNLTASKLLGQASSGGTGLPVPITLGSNLSMSGTTISATAGDKYLTSSTTSLTIANGTQSLTIGTGLSYTTQQDIVIAYNASNHMHATVTSYNSSTGALVAEVQGKTGSGTYAQWTVNVGGIAAGVIPAGGTTEQTLRKTSDSDYDVSWGSTVNGNTITSGTGTLNLNNSTLTLAIGANVTFSGSDNITLTVPSGGTSATLPASGTILSSTSSAVSFPTLNQNTSGNAATATTLATGRTLAITGDLTWTSPSFNGSANVTAAGTLATVNLNVGSFGSATQVATFTVNGKGLITAAGNTTVTPAVGSITGLGTGVAAALAIAPDTAGGFSTLRKYTGSASLWGEMNSIASGESDVVEITVSGAAAGDTAILDIPQPAFGIPQLSYYFTSNNKVTVCFRCVEADTELYWPENTNITATIIK